MNHFAHKRIVQMPPMRYIKGM